MNPMRFQVIWSIRCCFVPLPKAVPPRVLGEAEAVVIERDRRVFHGTTNVASPGVVVGETILCVLYFIYTLGVEDYNI